MDSHSSLIAQHQRIPQIFEIFLVFEIFHFFGANFHFFVVLIDPSRVALGLVSVLVGISLVWPQYLNLGAPLFHPHWPESRPGRL